MAHHIQSRSQLGRTRARNLITLCMRCHGLVHADLLILLGKNQERVRFVDREGHALHDPGAPLTASVLTRLDRRRAQDALGEPMGQALSRILAVQLARGESTMAALGGSRGCTTAPGADVSMAPSHAQATDMQASRPRTSARKLLTLEDIPVEADVYWWRKHGHLFDQGKGGSFRCKPSFAVECPTAPYLLGKHRIDPDNDDASPMPMSTPTPGLDRKPTPWPIRIGHLATETRASQAENSHPPLSKVGKMS